MRGGFTGFTRIPGPTPRLTVAHYAARLMSLFTSKGKLVATGTRLVCNCIIFALDRRFVSHLPSFFFFLFLSHAFCGLILRLPWNRSSSPTWENFQLCLALLVITVFTSMDLFNSTMQWRKYIGLHFFIPWVSTDTLQQILAPKVFTVHPSQQI